MQVTIKDLIASNIADGAEIMTSGPVRRNKIEQAEKMLGVKFPASYKSFIEEFGAIGIDGFNLAGLTERDVGEPGDVVAFTQYCRSEYGLPDEYIALNFDDGDYFLAIDTKMQDAMSESPIVLIDPVKKTHHGPISANSFGEYLIGFLSA